MIPTSVAEAFGVEGPPQRLPGGEETSVLADGIVLKPAFDAALAAWCQALAAAIDPSLVGIPEPVAAADGRWVVDGWTATRFVPGLVELADDPHTVVALDAVVTAALSSAASGLPPIPARSDRWARGVDAALGGPLPDLSTEAREVIRALQDRMADLPTRDRVVHGDLTGNTFQTHSGAPLVLDLSPYLAPQGFGAAVVVADHLLWRAGRAELAALVAPDLLARALMFRLIAEQLADAPRHGARLDDYRRALELLDR